MKNGWQTKTLGDVLEKTETVNPLLSPNAEFDYIDVSSVSNTTFEIEETQRLKGKDAPSRARKLVRTNDIIFATIRPTLQRIAVVPEHLDKQVCSTGYFVLRPKQGIDHRFVFYSLFTENFSGQMESLQKGASYPAVTDGDVRAQEIPVPPLAKQQRIVGLLDEAFAGLATAQANAEKNHQNARALFESHLQSVFTQRGKGWKMEKLDALTELARGHNPPKSKFSREPKPGYVRFYQIRDGGTDDYAVYVPDTPQLHRMKKDDIMMVAYRHVGRAFRGVEGAFNVALCKISNARRDLLDDDYLFHMIPSPFVKGELLKRSERSLIPSMSIEHLRELRIPLPPLREQQKIVELINKLSAETQRLVTLYERKLAALAALKKSLLHQAFTGELTKESVASAIVQPLLPPIPKLQGVTPTDLHAGILAVGYQAWEQANRQWMFGHVFGEKFSHVAEAMIEIDLGRNPVQDHFGPDDFPHLKKVEHRARMADFFTVHEKPGAGYQMARGRGFESLVAKTRTALGGLNKKLDEVIQLMLPMELKHAEVFATIYAAWNNLLMDGLKPTDEEIVLAAREKWHPDKLKIDRADFFKTIDWIRKKDICPQGKGKRVVRKTG